MYTRILRTHNSVNFLMVFVDLQHMTLIFVSVDERLPCTVVLWDGLFRDGRVRENHPVPAVAMCHL